MKFDEKGDGPARYTILNYQKNPETNGYDYKVSHMLVPSAQIPGGACGHNLQTGVQPGAFLP